VIKQQTTEMSIKIFIAILACATFTACNKSKVLEDKFITLSYPQTGCADAWANVASNDSLTLQNVAAYLNSKNLYVAGLSIKQDSIPDICKACFCKTGKIIYVSTFDETQTKANYAAIGFK
jgi:hypothetical protein